MSAAARLAPLRQELLLHRGPRAYDGSPTWVLEDPGRDLFFQIGWAEGEILSRWHLGSATAIAGAINKQTTLDVDAGQVNDFAGFLEQNSLTRDSKAGERYMREVRSRTGMPLGKFLLRNYLFFRVPLLRPDGFLSRTMPLVRGVFLNKVFALLTCAAAVIGLFLVTRQWDEFLHTFLHFFTLEGAVMAVLTLGAAKVLHELGHAYAAKYHGCRVPSMGVAFMVMMPLLYTDTSGAWRLRKRSQRMQVCAAGMLAETALAAWATLAWSFLPDGPLRSAAFILATTTWVMTLAVNMSPFMRFDGYFLFSDALGVPNLQNRAFALARWKMREWLFAFGDEKPEVHEPWRERVLILYAFGTWIYRFFLFLGIALLVYHMFFKLLGIMLFLVEICAFILLPVYKEMKEWFTRLRETGLNRRSAVTVSFLFVALLAALIPWSGSVTAPALLRAERQVRILAPVGAQVKRIQAVSGGEVRAGDPLFFLHSPELQQEIAMLRQQLDLLQWRLSFHFVLRETASAVPVAQRERQAALQRLALLESQERQLVISAPFDGRIVDLAEPLSENEWVHAGEWLGTVADPSGLLAVAYVDERELHRLRNAASAKFVPEDPGIGVVKLRVVHIDHTASRHLAAAPELASPNGGAIAAVRAQEQVAASLGSDVSVWMPEQAVYRVLLRPEHAAAGEALWQLQVLRGSVVIDADRQSPLMRFGRYFLAVFLRETGF